jgi:hypothetical protein
MVTAFAPRSRAYLPDVVDDPTVKRLLDAAAQAAGRAALAALIREMCSLSLG